MAKRPGAMSTEELIEHLHKQSDEIYRTLVRPAELGLPDREDPLAFVGAIGVPLLDWALSEMKYRTENDAIRIALETMRGTLIGVAETY